MVLDCTYFWLCSIIKAIEDIHINLTHQSNFLVECTKSFTQPLTIFCCLADLHDASTAIFDDSLILLSFFFSGSSAKNTKNE